MAASHLCANQQCRPNICAPTPNIAWRSCHHSILALAMHYVSKRASVLKANLCMLVFSPVLCRCYSQLSELITVLPCTHVYYFLLVVLLPKCHLISVMTAMHDWCSEFGCSEFGYCHYASKQLLPRETPVSQQCDQISS